MSFPDTKNIWRSYVPFFTTGRFRKVGKGFTQHCGPTAVSNCVWAYARRYGFTDVINLGPEEVFRRVAGLGARRLIFWNMDGPLFLGGTSDFLVPWYIHAAFDSFSLPRPKIAARKTAKPVYTIESLKKGALIYLELRRHPRYGNHHLIMIGVREDAAGNPVFSAADGWKSAEVLLTPSDLKHAYYFEVLP